MNPSPPRVIRSGISKLLFWMGLVIGGIGIVGGIAGVTGALLTGDTTLLGGLLFLLIFVAGGGLMHLAGRRARVELTAEQISWVPVLGGGTSIPWSAVHHVGVPQYWRDGKRARLVLWNGGRIEITAIRMSSGEGGTWADAGYLAAGEQIIEAHKAWLRSHTRP